MEMQVDWGVTVVGSMAVVVADFGASAAAARLALQSEGPPLGVCSDCADVEDVYVDAGVVEDEDGEGAVGASLLACIDQGCWTVLGGTAAAVLAEVLEVLVDKGTKASVQGEQVVQGCLYVSVQLLSGNRIRPYSGNLYFHNVAGDPGASLTVEVIILPTNAYDVALMCNHQNRRGAAPMESL
ncbi:hypothetical protein VOLCADRAFT_97743 [Volvox carteri f. nagariensis]|uniref:Uncharacterized protein n=1 Tax=Volvox carteri f. nagariensis TaxID=3068 RepID=D8UDI8_VOLCA|nr:uncharacterized protein VOLCADRAFT_97743 [Volvox carteri f. nagariensis]EFJ42175.1 hypothetical protein VOLCADRAFT_97743 [Volvox carteri f. nagariensis]|eukprot:XP_002956718.1 hypothetical protein VOLCADRAFT_97743 [Volvox carteri f. nagariensis]